MRSLGLSGAEYQSVIITPPKGSAEVIGIKETVSSVARHRKPLTPMPSCVGAFIVATKVKKIGAARIAHQAAVLIKLLTILIAVGGIAFETQAAASRKSEGDRYKKQAGVKEFPDFHPVNPLRKTRRGLRINPDSILYMPERTSFCKAVRALTGLWRGSHTGISNRLWTHFSLVCASVLYEIAASTGSNRLPQVT